MKKFVLLLDADDTLLDFKRCERRSIENTLTNFGLRCDEETISEYVRINLECWKMLECGKITRKRLDSLRFEVLFDKFGMNGVDPAEAGAYYRQQLNCSYFYIDGCHEFLSEMKKICRLYIVTNGTKPTQIQRLKGAGIDEYFDGFFYSEQIGCAKPYKGFFDYVFANIEDFDKSRCALMGDSLSSDIAGANASGITSIWYNPDCVTDTGKVEPDYVVQNYDDASTLIKMLAREF